MPSPEQTLIILKPDAVCRGLSGEVLRRFEAKGLKIAGLKMARLDHSILGIHYAAHREKPFYSGLVEFMSSGPVVMAVIEGPRAIEVVRKLMGKTFAWQAEPGTIRGDLGVSSQYNLIHGSDSPESARREIDLFFRPEEIFEYELSAGSWLVE